MVKFGWDKLKRFLAQANSWTGQQTFSNIAVTGGTISGVTQTDNFTTSTDPATSAAVTTAIVDAYNGVLITLTGAGNAQTLGTPTASTIKKFTVINNDTSTNSIVVNGITLTAGKSQTWIYDGSAWSEIDLGITSLPVPVNQGGTGQVTAQTAINALTAVSGATLNDVLTKDGSGNAVFAANVGGIPVAAAGGTVDAITANYTPDVTLSDQKMVAVVAAGANTSTTPSFAPDGLTAHTIVKNGGQALVAGDISGAGHVIILEYNLANTRWELLNPKVPAAFDPASPGAIGGTTAGTIRGLIDEETEAASDTLTANQLSGGMIDNIGQGANNVNYTLPAAAEGYNFVVVAGEPSANYLRITAAVAGTMIVDGVPNKNYASFATPALGNFLTAFTAKSAPGSEGILTGAALAIGSTKSSVANGAFTYYIAGTKYAKGATAAGTAPNAVTTAQNKYGCQAFDIGADGTIDPISCTNIAAGLDSAALAYADLPDVAANHVRIGYVTAMSSDAGGFVWATTLFDDAAVTEAYTSTAAYTAIYNWIVTTGSGSVTTN